MRKWDLDHPDELRVDLDPQPGVPFSAVRQVAGVVRDVLVEHDMVGFPKTSGSRGIHINVRIVAKWSFAEVRRAAVALAREVERRAPDVATSKWWKEERGDRVFIDYNQNARDRTVASVLFGTGTTPRGWCPPPSAGTSSTPWRLADFTLASMPARWAEVGDLEARIDETTCSLAGLLEQSQRDEAEGLGDAPWPPNFPKQEGEPRRVQPSKKRIDLPEPEDR